MVTTRMSAIALVMGISVPALTAGEKPAPILRILNAPGFTNTEAHGIGPTGAISGNHNAPGLGNHGFVHDGPGHTTLDVPGLSTLYPRTSPTGDAVAIAGARRAPLRATGSGGDSGFLLTR